MAALVEALAECLEAVRTGGDLEECLQRYPQHRKQLQLLLDVARRIEPFPPLGEADRPSPDRVRKLISEIRRRPRATERPEPPPGEDAETRGAGSGGLRDTGA